MRIAIAGLVSVLAGAVLGLILIWYWLGGPERADAAGWTVIMAIFTVPMLVMALGVGLAVLEAASRWLVVPRLAVFLAGALLIPLGVFLLTGGPDLVAVMAGNRSVSTTPLLIAAWVTAPALLSNVLFWLLTTTWRPADLVRSKPLLPPIASPPPPPGAPGPFAPVVLTQPPTSQRLLEIMSSPDQRIGQHLFKYCIQLWIQAAAVWFVLALMGGQLIGLPYDVRLVISLTGWFVLFWAAFCACANRLHDLGWSAAFALAPIAAALAILYLQGPPASGWASVNALVHWVIAMNWCFGAFAGFLLLRKGDPLPNRFGSAP